MPVNQVQVDTKMLASLLNVLNTSFESFILAEMFFRNSSIKQALKKEIFKLLAECRMLIQNISFNSFTLALDLNATAENEHYRTIKNVAELKRELFELYCTTVFNPDLFDTDFIELLSHRYSAKERINIFKPIFDLSDQQEFTFYFGTEEKDVNQDWLGKHDLMLRSSLIPDVVKSSKEQVETYYQYIKTGEVNDLFGKRSKYEKVLIKENPKHDLYPYQVQKINVKGKKYTFSKQITALVSVKNSYYEINFPELLLSVTHENRSGAEKAFDMALAALILQLEKGQQQKNLNLIKLKGILNEE